MTACFFFHKNDIIREFSRPKKFGISDEVKTLEKSYQKERLVMDCLRDLGVSMLAVGMAIDDKNIERSYQLIKNNPQITKTEFLTEMGIEEE